MTATRKWIAGTVVIALVVLAGSWFLLVSPKRGEAADLQSEADSQLNVNQALTTELALLKQQKKDLPEQQAQLAELQTQVPQTPSMPSLIRLLDTAGTRSGVDLVSMAPAAAIPVMSAEGATDAVDGVLPADQLAAVNADIVIHGGYFEIVKFVNSLENLERYVLVTNMTITQPDTATDTSSTSSADEGQLTATLSSRVFLLPAAAEVTTTTTDPAAASATTAQ